MDFQLTEEQETIRACRARAGLGLRRRLLAERDGKHEFPWDFYKAIRRRRLARDLRAGGAGGSGLGITEASILLEEVAASGAGMNGASTIHGMIFGMHPVDQARSREMKDWPLPRIVSGRDARLLRGDRAERRGLDTTAITTFAERPNDAHPDHYLVNGRKVLISKALHPTRSCC